MKLATAVLLLLSTPAFAGPFDGLWQETTYGTRSRHAIHDHTFSTYEEQDGKFVLDGTCRVRFERRAHYVLMSFHGWCQSPGKGPFLQVNNYLLSVKDANTLRVELVLDGTDGKSMLRGSHSEWTRVP